MLSEVVRIYIIFWIFVETYEWRISFAIFTTDFEIAINGTHISHFLPLIQYMQLSKEWKKELELLSVLIFIILNYLEYFSHAQTFNFLPMLLLFAEKNILVV